MHYGYSYIDLNTRTTCFNNSTNHTFTREGSPWQAPPVIIIIIIIINSGSSSSSSSSSIVFINDIAGLSIRVYP